ncbi:hypothetical protein [Rhizobium sullae]|uniref:hypothetical protein n=1 Tax=Rhizobium sullae TaxID=50338 RepID=UPI0015C65DA8|nr:hypothetical protein [Rhizobium sullae]
MKLFRSPSNANRASANKPHDDIQGRHVPAVVSGCYALQQGEHQVMEYGIVAARLDADEKSGCIILQVGLQCRTVLVTRRAILNVASPPRSSEAHFLEHVRTFCEIAVNRMQTLIVNQDIVITADDVRGWRRHWPSSPAKLFSRSNETRNSWRHIGKQPHHLRLVSAKSPEEKSCTVEGS